MKYLFAFLLLLAACAPPEAQKALPPPLIDGRGNLIVFGDSISACSTCFPGMVSAGLTNNKVINLADPGSTVRGDTQIGRIMASNPEPGDRVIFLTGYNDLRGYGLAGLEQYATALQQALQHFKKEGQPTYIGTVMKPLCGDAEAIAANNRGCDAGAHEAYVDRIRLEVRLADASNIHIVETGALWEPSRSSLADLVHPTPAGHAALASFFLEAISQN